MARHNRQRSIFLPGSQPNWQYEYDAPSPVATRYSLITPSGVRFTVLEPGQARGSKEVVDWAAHQLIDYSKLMR